MSEPAYDVVFAGVSGAVFVAVREVVDDVVYWPVYESVSAVAYWGVDGAVYSPVERQF